MTLLIKTKKAFDEVVKRLENNDSNLSTELDFSIVGSRISLERFKKLNNALANNTDGRPKSLVFGKNKIDKIRAGLIADTLLANKTILSLDLGRTSIDTESEAILAEMLKINQTLRHLYLNDTKFSHEGLIKIFEALAQNNQSSLSHLNLSGNSIKNIRPQIANLLKVNNSIQDLDLSNNEISNENLEDLIEGLKNNISLLKLKFDEKTKEIGNITEIKNYLLINEVLNQFKSDNHSRLLLLKVSKSTSENRLEEKSLIQDYEFYVAINDKSKKEILDSMANSTPNIIKSNEENIHEYLTEIIPGAKLISLKELGEKIKTNSALTKQDFKTIPDIELKIGLQIIKLENAKPIFNLETAAIMTLREQYGKQQGKVTAKSISSENEELSEQADFSSSYKKESELKIRITTRRAEESLTEDNAIPSNSSCNPQTPTGYSILNPIIAKHFATPDPNRGLNK